MAGTSASRVGPSSITMVTVSGHNDDGSHLSRGNERSGRGPMVCPARAKTSLGLVQVKFAEVQSFQVGVTWKILHVHHPRYNKSPTASKLEPSTQQNERRSRCRDYVEDSPTEDSPSTRGLLATDHVILNYCQLTWTTPKLAPPLLTTTPYQREDVSALDRFNMHRCPTRRIFSDTGLELVTRQATILYPSHSATVDTLNLSRRGVKVWRGSGKRRCRSRHLTEAQNYEVHRQ
ncbi:uncharacterized protein TNCV_2705401 [Trichonephila clavipes]|nr:uncharacterized protein TNCV_2705401 [Trichonephila clavipes]